MRKTLLVAGAAVAAVLVAGAAAVALFFDANQFRPQLERAIGGALGRKVTIGHLRLAPLSGGIAVDDLSIADDPAFSDAPL
jgi:AsmA protein